jgi:hypothetical protein
VQINRFALYSAGKCFTFDILHYNEAASRFLIHFVDGADVRMIQPGGLLLLLAGAAS